ncbi:MAG: hypothetical protein AAFO82_09435 [Bacteroidota bacterium]
MNIIFKSKFIKALQTFSEDELKSFDAWLRSPWCNTNKNLVRLLGKVRKYYPTFDDRKLTKEKLFKQILPSGKFSDRRMNNLLSEAYLAAERFLIHQNLSQDTRLQKDLLAQEWQNRDSEERFLKESQKVIDLMDDISIKEWEDHLDLYRHHRRLYHHPNQSRRIQYGSAIISRMGEELDLLYLLEKATILNEKKFRNRILQNEQHETEHDLQLWLQATKHLQHPAIEFYRMRFAYTEENRLAHYRKLRAAFMEGYEELGELQQKIHLTSLLNDTTILIKEKSISTIELLPLYKLGLKANLIFHREKLSYHTYSTVVGASNLKGDYDYTYYFIENFTDRLNEKNQLDAINWAKAHTMYYEKKLSKSLDILLIYQFKTPYFLMIGRVLTLQVYFDLYLQDNNYQSYLFSYLDTFEKWLQREKMWSKANKVSFLRFVQKCRALAKHYADVNFQRVKLEQLLDGTEAIQALSWLKMKQEEIIRLKTK